MKVYCKNKECRHYRVLDRPVSFSFNKFSEPLGNLARGYCSIEPEFIPVDYSSSDFKATQTVCHQAKGLCKQSLCLHNDLGACKRGEILVEESLISKYIICKCFSNRSLSGHVDWSRNLKSDKTAKGGRF